MKSQINYKNYDFSDYVEITGDALYKINGGAQVENTMEGVAGAKPGDTIIRNDNTEVTLKQIDIDIANQQLGGSNTNTANTSSTTQNYNPTGSTGSSSSNSQKTSSDKSKSQQNQMYNNSDIDVPEEIKNNPEAYAYYMSLQAKAIEAGDSIKYKDYNVMGIGKMATKKEIIPVQIQTKTASKNESTYKTIDSSKWNYIPIEGVGINGTSVFKTTGIINQEGNVEINALGDFIGKNLVDSSQFFGTATLIVDGKNVETKAYKYDTKDCIWPGGYERIGTVNFNYNCSNAKTIQIKSDVDLIIGSYGLGNTIVNYSPTNLELR